MCETLLTTGDSNEGVYTYLDSVEFIHAFD